MPRPVKELQAFENVFLQKGEKKTVSVSISFAELGYYNIMLSDWVTENGRYDVYVGSSSRDIRLNGHVFLQQEKERYTICRVGNDQIGE